MKTGVDPIKRREIIPDLKGPIFSAADEYSIDAAIYTQWLRDFSRWIQSPPEPSRCLETHGTHHGTRSTRSTRKDGFSAPATIPGPQNSLSIKLGNFLRKAWTGFNPLKKSFFGFSRRRILSLILKLVSDSFRTI